MAQSNTSPPLAHILREVIRCVASGRAGQSWSALAATVPAHLRPGVQALVFSVWRAQGLAVALVARLAAKAPDAPTHAALVTALALLNTEPMPYAAHTLVSQTIDCLRADKRVAAKAGFVNACLRRFLRERETLCADARTELPARWNLPAWWLARLQADHPSDWQVVAEQSHRPAAMVVRANPPSKRSSTRFSANFEENRPHVGEFRSFFAANSIANTVYPVGETAWAIQPPRPVSQLLGFEQGALSVQDAAAQLAAPLLLRAGNPGGLRVLDACAAPGGKTAHLAQWLRQHRGEHAHTLIALERDATRATRISENLERCGWRDAGNGTHTPIDADADSGVPTHVQVRIQVADAAKPPAWHDGKPFDAVLLDAPCTASGIVRRHPDVAWLRRETDVAQLAAEQRRLLDALWPLVMPGGVLLYCTCSVFRAEGSEQAQAFVSRNTDARPLPAPGHLLPRRSAPGDPFTDNEPCERDGFFYALFQKSADV